MTMTPTLHTFIQALQTPDISFTTLADARPATEAGGIPQLMRTTSVKTYIENSLKEIP